MNMCNGDLKYYFRLWEKQAAERKELEKIAMDTWPPEPTEHIVDIPLPVLFRDCSDVYLQSLSIMQDRRDEGIPCNEGILFFKVEE